MRDMGVRGIVCFSSLRALRYAHEVEDLSEVVALDNVKITGESLLFGGSILLKAILVMLWLSKVGDTGSILLFP
ncbi:hypothetical protein QQ045_010324 [Rhodiola kirilowii]